MQQLPTPKKIWDVHDSLKLIHTLVARICDNWPEFSNVYGDDAETQDEQEAG